ncbi:MAG: hypothetical protein JWM58_2912, partial [Rhizobium sp.]|nr:hypothetical protein [Rhizobium sp.]
MSSVPTNRRHALGILTGSLLAAICLPAWAKDGGEGHDDGGHDDGGHDDDGGHTSRGKDDYSQDEALNEVRTGRIIPLKAALRIVDEKVGGKVIDVNLIRRQRPQYRVKVRRESGNIIIILLDARTGRFIGFLV